MSDCVEVFVPERLCVLGEYARQHILYGYIIDGNSFDFGNAKAYYDSFVNYGKE